MIKRAPDCFSILLGLDGLLGRSTGLVLVAWYSLVLQNGRPLYIGFLSLLGIYWKFLFTFRLIPFPFRYCPSILCSSVDFFCKVFDVFRCAPCYLSMFLMALWLLYDLLVYWSFICVPLFIGICFALWSFFLGLWT
jgi:hypothetical protein